MASKMGCKSCGEFAMARSTSEMAVCCSMSSVTRSCSSEPMHELVRRPRRRPDSVVVLSRMFLCLRNGTARTQTIDFGHAESQLPENFLVVFANLRGALRGYFGDAMDLKRAADGGRQLATGTFERNNDVVRPELGIVDHLLRPTHRSKRHVDAIEHLVPMCHRLGTEDLVEDRR